MEKIVVANHKMSLGLSDIKKYIDKLEGSDVIVCPSALYAPYFVKAGIKTGLQNISSFEGGAYTGEISAFQARSLGIKYVIIGHSERRKYFFEDNMTINCKVKLALKNGLVPILCVGDDYDEDYKVVLKKQLDECLCDVDSEVIIAYEPICSIGTGVSLDSSKIKEVVFYIKSIKPNLDVLYGGSVNKNNIMFLKDIDGLSGYLVGGASTSADDLLKIREVC